ncbi:MAG TPA: hypothetical protein VLA51_10005, partial [Paracoccaceae bacterium]|nr:hypothetical protein [Paracoccaceae bacterium]
MNLSYDVIVLADFTCGGDAGFRIAQDIRGFSALGARIGLIHLRNGSLAAAVSPDMQLCVRDGFADILQSSPEVHARLALVYPPATLRAPMQPLADVSADKVAFIHDRKPNAV